MAGSNGLTRLAVLFLLDGSSNDSKPSNKWVTLGSYMTWLFVLSVAGTYVWRSPLDCSPGMASPGGVSDIQK